MVSYARKHNEANGEDNRDGTDANYSANYGVEGPTDDPAIDGVRTRQIKNFILTLFVARGVPMLLSGDEFRRTQQGNNNAYCQDNKVGWVDWGRLDAHGNIHRFVRSMIRFRRGHSVLGRVAFYTDREVHWFNPAGQTPRWDDPSARQLGMHVRDADGPDLCFLFNADTATASFALPKPPEEVYWHRKADTAQVSPDDWVLAEQEGPLDDQAHYRVEARSSVILVGQ